MRWLAMLLLFVLLSAVFFWSVGKIVRTFTTESTDDAFLDEHIISIAPKIAGHVLAVHVAHNQEVKKGDLLLEIDPRD